MSQLRGSQHYIWSLADVLGQGATGAVYKARHKNTGELYAVKTFNQMSYLRSPAVQAREFDVLKRLNHENIVRLLAIEEESSSRADVLIMELCTGGSLFNQLDDPENAYGIEEMEFQRVLLDVANGMKHLWDEKIVHRDIKPGNIMRYISEDGRSIYKLIDFGAARELQNEEQFISLYGTEEYLFPDMYERAVLKRSTGKQFSAVVDLWSLGVTFYHIATGQLPFRPYGGRKNKETMYQITSEKASGVVSGIQSMDGGPIEWSRQMPSTCRLSQGMKRLMTPVLARLLESDPEKMMKFEEFFDAVKDITSKLVIYVFDLSKSCLLYIYIDKNEHLARFQELVAEQTDIRTQDQQLLFENHEFEKIVKPLQRVGTYPHTSTQNPIYLFSSSHNLTPMPMSCYVPTLPIFPSDLSLDNDALLAKNCCGIVHLIHRLIIDLHLKQQLIGKAAKMYLLVLSRELEHIKDLVSEFSLRVDEIGKRLKLLTESSNVLMSTLVSKINSRPNEGDAKRQMDSLKNVFQCASVDNQKENFNELYINLMKMKGDIESLSSRVLTEVLDLCGCKDDDSCIPKANMFLNAVKQTVADFLRDRSLKKLSFNEEQIHKFDRRKMKTNYEKAMVLVDKSCYQNTKKVYEGFQSWYSQVWEIQQKLQSIKNDVVKVSEWERYLSEGLSQTQDMRQWKLKILLDDLGISSEFVELKVSETRTDVSLSNFGHILHSRSKNKEVRELIKTLKASVLANSTITSDVKNEVEKSEKLCFELQNRQREQYDAADARTAGTNEEPMTLTATN